MERRTEGRAINPPEPSVTIVCEISEQSDLSRRGQHRYVATRPVPGTGFEPVRPFGPLFADDGVYQFR
jgi:hypothetical protein